jgi:signal transduction histidine kinase
MENKGILQINVEFNEKQVSVAFTDNGPGIPEDIKSKIFEPFFTTKAAGEGSGLGLDIVKKILDKHDGTIDVESVVGKTIFTIIIPIVSN